jgi:hypothetical protein
LLQTSATVPAQMTRAVDKGALMSTPLLAKKPIPVSTDPISVTSSAIENHLGDQQSLTISGWLAGLSTVKKPRKHRT